MNAIIQEKFRHVPYDIEVEQALLGALIVDSGKFWRVASSLQAEDFYDPLHERIYRTLAAHIERDERVTPLTLHAAMKADPGLAEVGGHAYFSGLAQAAPALGNIAAHASILRELALRRALIRIGEEAVNSAYETPDERSATQIADEIGEKLYDAAHACEGPNKGPERLVDVAMRAATAAETARSAPDDARVTTGLQSVDEGLGGLFPGHLHVLGAPPSVGKSGIIAQFALAAARAGYPGLLFSKEMASEEIATRYLAAEVGVPANRIDEGRTRCQDVEAMVLAARAYEGIPLFLDGASNLSVAQMRGRAQALRRRHGKLCFAVADHLRLIKAADLRAPEHERLDQITKDLKAMAKDLNIAILLVVTLNRELWKRATKRPLISDLYGASAIEYNADHIWFLHREEFFLDRDEPDSSDQKAHDEWERKRIAAKDKAELFSAKRRGGPLSSVMLKFDAPFVRFTETDDFETRANQEAML